MLVTALLDNQSALRYQILNILLEQSQPISLKILMDKVDISKQTLTKYLDEINQMYQEEELEACISTNPETIRIILDATLSFKDLCWPLIRNSLSVHVIELLLNHPNLSNYQMASTLMISEATLSRQLVQLNQALKEFSIQIKNGMWYGPEEQVRYFYYEFYRHFYPDNELFRLKHDANLDQSLAIFEHRLSTNLTLVQREKLSLWLGISQKRWRQKDKDYSQLINRFKPYQEVVFFDRIYQAVLRYLIQFSLKLDEGEIYALMAFILSMDLLDYSNNERLLGFGGPIAKASQCFLNQVKNLTQKGQAVMREEVLYCFGQSSTKLYFFEGAILQKPLVADPKCLSMVKIVMETIFKRKFKKANNITITISETLNTLVDYLNLPPCKEHKIGVLLLGDPIKNSIQRLQLQKTLEQPPYITFETFDQKKWLDDDLVITNVNLPEKNSVQVYRLKNSSMTYDFTQLKLIFRNLLY